MLNSVSLYRSPFISVSRQRDLSSIWTSNGASTYRISHRNNSLCDWGDPAANKTAKLHKTTFASNAQIWLAKSEFWKESAKWCPRYVSGTERKQLGHNHVIHVPYITESTTRRFGCRSRLKSGTGCRKIRWMEIIGKWKFSRISDAGSKF